MSRAKDRRQYPTGDFPNAPLPEEDLVGVRDDHWVGRATPLHTVVIHRQNMARRDRAVLAQRHAQVGNHMAAGDRGKVFDTVGKLREPAKHRVPTVVNRGHAGCG